MLLTKLASDHLLLTNKTIGEKEKKGKPEFQQRTMPGVEDIMYHHVCEEEPHVLVMYCMTQVTQTFTHNKHITTHTKDGDKSLLGRLKLHL